MSAFEAANVGNDERTIDYMIVPYTKLYYGAAGTTACSEMMNCNDVTLKLEADESDITTRPSVDRIVTNVSLKDVSLEFDMDWDTSDNGFEAIKNAYFSNTAIALFVSDGNGNGLNADFVVTSFSRSDSLDDDLTVSVICKPTCVIGKPTWRRS